LFNNLEEAKLEFEYAKCYFNNLPVDVSNKEFEFALHNLENAKMGVDICYLKTKI
jgi:hypothetical protein